MNECVCVQVYNSFVYIVLSSRDLSGCLGNGMGGAVFPTFLPGICMSLCQLATSDGHVGQVRISHMIVTCTPY